MRRQGQVSKAGGAEPEGDTAEKEDEEVPDEELERSNEAHRAKMERRKEGRGEGLKPQTCPKVQGACKQNSSLREQGCGSLHVGIVNQS